MKKMSRFMRALLGVEVQAVTFITLLAFQAAIVQTDGNRLAQMRVRSRLPMEGTAGMPRR
jgi:hypothetical protein